MTCLVYGILASAPAPSRCGRGSVLPVGVGEAPVRLIEACGLSAAVSTIDAADIVPNVTRALAYAQVVEALHAERTILPMRYGCACSDESEVAALLRTRREEYAATLHRLEGCVEMGVRIPAASVDAAFVGGPRRPQGDAYADSVAARRTGGPGTAYLTRRARVCAEEDRWAHRLAGVTERLRAAFVGRYVECKTEIPQRSLPAIAAYFLVQREDLVAFRAAFHDLSRMQDAPLRLSGPWPPYNFAA